MISSPTVDKAPIRALIYTKTAGYRHGSIPSLVSAVLSLFSDRSHVVATESSEEFLNHIESVQVLILGSNTGCFLEKQDKNALEKFARGGGSLVGIHACTAGNPDWVFYGTQLGAVFDGHPKPQWGLVTVREPDHFITKGLPSPTVPAPHSAPNPPQNLREMVSSTHVMPWFDEWYNFKNIVTDNGTVRRRDLVTVDESTYSGGTIGSYHPLVWTQEFDETGSRVFYTALGHFDEAYSDAWFMTMLKRGLYWAVKRESDYSNH